MTGKMIFKVIRLWLHTTTYSRKDKYQDRCFIKERPGQHQGRQLRCANAQGRTMDKTTNNGRNNPTKKKSSGRRNHSTRRNKMEQY